MRAERLRRPGAFAWVASIALLTAAPPWLAMAVPTKDGPSHLYNAWVLVNLGDATLGLERHFAVVPSAPNWGGIAPLVLLLQFLPPLAAEKALMSLLLAGFVLGTAAVARGAGADPVLLALLAGVVAHGFLFAMGFTAYQLAVVAALALASWELSFPDAETLPRRRAVVPALTLASLFFVHIAGALVAAGLWMLAAFLRRRCTWRNAGLSLAPLVALWAAHVALRAEVPPPVYRPDHRGPWLRTLDLATGNYWEAFGPEDCVVGATLLMLIASLVGLRSLRRGAPRRRDAVLFTLGGGVCLLAYLAVPWALAGGAFLPDRLVPLLLLLPAVGASAGLPRSPWPRALAALLLVGALGVRARQYEYWGAHQMRLADQVPALPRGATAYMESRPGVATAVDPLTHVWARVAVRDELVALDDYEAALVGLFPVAFRPPTLALLERVRAGDRPADVLVFGWR